METGELHKYKKLIQRRIRREPVAYIVGKKEFWSMDFVVNPDVLIPRPETECLVEAVLDHLPKNTQSSDVFVLELGTGSGAIVLSLAAERPERLLFASDKSYEALKIAKKNAKLHGLEQRIHFFASNWCDSIDSKRIQFDVIVSNPPYIMSSEIQTLAPEIFRFEPWHALNGGEDGLVCIRRILEDAARYLKTGGWLLLEMGWDQKESVKQIVEHCGLYDQLTFRKDYAGNNRVVAVRSR
jgi:release factor glutamine methyltransferase